MVRTGILLYDPRGQNDPRNRALDDQLDRLRWERNLLNFTLHSRIKFDA